MKQVIERIVEGLNQLENEDFYKEYVNANKSYKYITDFIKTLFAKEGRKEELGNQSCAHRNLYAYKDFKYDEGEWMFDFVWYKMSEENDQLMESIPLVLESELSNKELGGLKVDFDKLLVASNSTKVFVTTQHNLQSKIEYIQKAINAFKFFSYDETLYLIIWDENDTGLFSLKEFKKQ